MPKRMASVSLASIVTRHLLLRLLVGRGVQRDGGAANCMPGGNPADESPGVIAPFSQLGHGRATDLKSANAINRDRRSRGSSLIQLGSAAGACIEAPASISVRRGRSL